MANQGEMWVKSVLEDFGYTVVQLSTEDCLAFIDDRNVLLIEERDNKYPLQVGNIKVQTVSKNNKFPFNFAQINNHCKRVVEGFRDQNRFFKIIPIFVVSNMLGNHVNYLINPKGEREYKGIFFFINKDYFRDWVSSFPKVFIGFGGIQRYNMYMGGK